MYFKANPNAAKFYNALPTFLNLLQELFNRFLAIGNNARSINEIIESCIDPEILTATASQATDLVGKEDKEEGKEEGKEDLESESAQSSLKRSQLSLPSVNRSSALSILEPSLIPS